LCEKTADFVEHFGQRKTPLETFTDLKNDTVTQPSFTPACPTSGTGFVAIASRIILVEVGLYSRGLRH